MIFFGEIRGVKFLSKKIRGLKIYSEKIRGLKILGFSEENTPGGYSPLKMTAPLWSFVSWWDRLLIGQLLWRNFLGNQSLFLIGGFIYESKYPPFVIDRVLFYYSQLVPWYLTRNLQYDNTILQYDNMILHDDIEWCWITIFWIIISNYDIELS